MKNQIIEIGAVKVIDGKITDKFSTFVNPQVPIPFRDRGADQVSMMTWSWMHRSLTDILPEFMEFCEGCVMVAHNASFDMSFIERELQQAWACRVRLQQLWIRWRWHVFFCRSLNRFKLDTVAKALEHFTGKSSPGRGRCGLYGRDF